jgi:FkbM family methyltransferase
MGQTMLLILGKIAAFSRRMGLGSLVNTSNNLMDFAFMKAGRPPLRVKMDGLEVCGFLRHRSFLEQLSSGKYESFSRQLYERALRPGMTVIDGGAHIGLYSLLASQRIGNDGRVLSFEPDPYNFKALSFNAKKTRYKNIILVQKALSKLVGKTSFFQNPGTISSSLFDRKGIGKCKRIEAKCTTLDYELGKLKIDSILMKLDLEGAEPLALQGMSTILRSINSIAIFAEINPSALHDAGLDPQDMINELQDRGFKICFIDELNKKLTSVNKPAIIQKGMIFCVKES